MTDEYHEPANDFSTLKRPREEGSDSSHEEDHRRSPIPYALDETPFGLTDEEILRLWQQDLEQFPNENLKQRWDEDLKRLPDEKVTRRLRDRKPGQPPPVGELTSAGDDPDPGRSYLCSTCLKFMERLHEHPWADEDRADRPFGWAHLTSEKATRLLSWQQMFFFDECGLCQIVYEAVVSFFAAQCLSPDLSEHSYLLRPSKYGSVPDLVPKLCFGQEVSTKKVFRARWCLTIEINNMTKHFSQARPMILNAIHAGLRPLPSPSYQLPMQQAPFLERGYLHARARTPECDILLFRKWFEFCESYHCTLCSQTPFRHGPGIRLIDTQDDCVKSYIAESSQTPHYVALSYVCGEKPQSYISLGHSYSSFLRKGALRNLSLSKTIDDAIVLTRQLGLRYLWVDALCIDQQDAVDRQQQIANMASVYRCATFTIVAGYGDDCNAGLAGMRHGTRSEQQVVEMGNIALLRSLHTGGDRILSDKESKWARRGWCYQEALLSTRQLIFTSEQVWWRCRCATWCEASQLETDDPVSFMLEGQPSSTPLEVQFSTLRPNDFFDLVGNYARRQLTFASDALNAFAGILSMITSLSGQHFFWGHMTAGFESQLWWVGKSTMRSPLHANASDHPTWSWVGWEGEVSFRHYLTYEPLILCFAIHADDSDFAYSRVSSTSFPHPQAQMQVLDSEEVEKIVPNIIQGTQGQYLDAPIRCDYHLFFHTYSATFYLMPYGRLILPQLAPRFAYDKEGNMLGPKPDYGYLVPSLDGPELCEQGERECILLGRKAPSSEWDRSHVIVMLITRVSGIAYRLGIADMAEEFWDLAEKTWQMIILG